MYLTDLLSDDVLARLDVIGFDPRGVGRSSPLQCITDPEKERLISINPDVRTPAGRALARGASGAVARSCNAKYGAALGHYNTEETARDMDLVRAAVCDRLLNYLGYSYGAKLGATYAHLFPTRIRTAVLDAPADPLADDVTIAERQTSRSKTPSIGTPPTAPDDPPAPLWAIPDGRSCP